MKTLFRQPQMVDTYSKSDDGLVWTFVLRDGLTFHDGAPVTGEDVVASLTRWGARDGMGQQLFAVIKSLEAKDAKTVVMTLKEPYGLVLESIGKLSSNVPVIMPQAHCRNRSERADQGIYRLRSVRFSKRRMGARLQSGLHQVRRLRAA